MRRILTVILAGLMAVSMFALPASASSNVEEISTAVGGSSGDYSTLLAVVADDPVLVEAINAATQEAPLTILAPDNAAFERAARQVALLLGDKNWRHASAASVFGPLLAADEPNELLRSIVLGHVIAGAADSSVVFDRRVNRFDTLNGRITTFQRGLRILDGSGRISVVELPDVVLADGAITIHGIERNVIFPRGTIRTVLSLR